MLAVKRILVPLSLVALCLGLCTAGCGGNGDGGGSETVYLYIVNGYPGTSAMTLYGPTGKLASGLEFGARTEEALEVDRNTNSDEFTLVLDGAPTAMTFNKQLFSLYPQETATVIVSRRAGENSAEATLYRHTRSPDPDCVMTFGNSLSLNNAYLPEEILSYSYQTEWNVDPKPMYDEAREQYATTRCGYTAVLDRYKRPEVHEKIRNDPWFFPVSGQEGGYTLVWGERRMDPRTGEQRSEGLGLSGQVRAQPTTRDFMDCLSGAVTVQPPQGGGGGTTPAEQECPDPSGPTVQLPNGKSVDLLGTNQVIWNAEAAATCFELFKYTGFPVEPGQSDTFQSFSMQPYEPGSQACSGDYECGGGECIGGHCVSSGAHNAEDLVCGSPVRIRTPSQDLIFQNIDSSIPGYIDNEGGFIELDATYPMSEQHFFVVFGRPINAFVDQWNSEETSVMSDGGEFAYPGDILPKYGNDQN